MNLKEPESNEKRYFDESSIPKDVWQVLRTASLLSVGEFRVFEIAYQDWYGESGDEKLIESHFIPYMFNDLVPIWVRHFCKKVLKLDSDDALDPSDFGIVHRESTLQQRNRGLEYIMLLILFLLALFFLGEHAAQVLRLQCLFPPCY